MATYGSHTSVPTYSGAKTIPGHQAYEVNSPVYTLHGAFKPVPDQVYNDPVRVNGANGHLQLLVWQFL